MCQWCRNTGRYECGPDACDNGGRYSLSAAAEATLDRDGKYHVIEGGEVQLLAEDAHPVYFPLDMPNCDCGEGTFLEVLVSKSIHQGGGKPEAFVALTPTRCVTTEELPPEVRTQMGIGGG